MRWGWLAVIGVGLWSGRAEAIRDSLRVDTLGFAFPPLRIEAVAPSESGFVPVRRLDAAEMARRLLWQGAEAVAGLPGVFLRDYGGLGGLKTVSIRGLGASQVLVLWEGVRLNTALHGVYDLGNLPTSFIEELEVVAGGGSAMLGAHAGSGIIVVRSLPKRSVPLLRATLGRGSFGEERATVLGHATGSRVSLRLGMEYLHGRGDYPFVVNQFGRLQRERRQNGDRTALATLVAMRYEAPSFWGWGQLIGYQSQRGVPGAVIQGRVENVRARLEEEEWLGVVGAVVPALRLEWSMALRRSWLLYRDPDARLWGPRGAYDDARAWEASSSLRWSSPLGQWLYGGLGGELRWESIHGSLLRPQGQHTAQRGGVALQAWLRATVGVGELFCGLRGESHQQYAPAVSPTLGLQAIWGNVRLRLQWSDNFRPPSFAELYYFNFGNPSLRPERTRSWNMGLEWRPSRALWVQGDAFVLWVRDQIIAVPRSPVLWHARNLGRVWSRGVELNAICAPTAALRLSAQLTWQRVTDQTGNPYTHGRQLPYVPLLLAAGSCSIRLEPVEFTVQLTAIGERWSQADQAPDSRLPPYVRADYLVHSRLLTTQSLRGELHLAVRNLFDVAGEYIRNYPLPGRALRVEVVLTWYPAERF